MVMLLDGGCAIIAGLATFARGAWFERSYRPAHLSLAEMVYIMAVQLGLVLCIGAGMCTLAAIAATALKWFL